MRVYKNNSEDIIVCNDIAFCLERTERYEESLEYIINVSKRILLIVISGSILVLSMLQLKSLTRL
jgi:hypothetical protein